MSSKHTPGPWTVDDREYAGVKWDAIIRNRDNDPVACVGMAGYTEATGQANAHLIAAAPDMLEALKKLQDSEYETVDEFFLITNAAIAKAEGKEG